MGDWHSEFNSAENSVAREALCCHCYVYGRVARRLEIFPMEPEYEEDCNTACAFGGGPLALCLQRRDIRARFGIAGDMWEDWWTALCCPVQTVVQHELEVKERASQGPPIGTEEYRSPKNAMIYPPRADDREEHQLP